MPTSDKFLPLDNTTSSNNTTEEKKQSAYNIRTLHHLYKTKK